MPTPEEIERHKQDWKQRHELVLQAGGLHVLGTERHESRRIDNQLRGRSGRQGDPAVRSFIYLWKIIYYVFLPPNAWRALCAV